MSAVHRVLIVVHGFPPAAQGGAEIYAHDQARWLARHGDEVLVVTREADAARPERDVRMESRDGVTIAWLNQTFRDVRRFEDAYRDERITAALAPIIDRFSPDVAHIHHLTCLSTTLVMHLASRGVPMVGTLHDYWLLCHRGQLLDLDLRVCEGPGVDGCGRCIGVEGAAEIGWMRAGRRLARAVPALAGAARSLGVRLAAAAGVSAGGRARARSRQLSRARMAHMREVVAAVDRWLAPSVFMRDVFVAAGAPAERVEVWPYGVGVSESPGAVSDREGAASDRPLRVGFLGSLMLSKAPHLLLDAVAALPPGSAIVDLAGAPVDYHGDTRYRAALEPRLRAPTVIRRGPLAHADIPVWFAGIDVLVVPSLWPENSPFVIREAFAHGVPVLAARTGGIPETVRDGDGGLTFAPGDVADLQRQLQRLVDGPNSLRPLRERIPAVRTLDDDAAATRALHAGLARRSRVIHVRPPAPPRRRLAAVVLNYQTSDDTCLAVRSLLASTRRVDDVIVVDNDADGDCERRLPPLRDRVDYVRTGANLGYAGGMNVGIARALARGAGRVFVMNSDVLVAPSCLAALERALDETPGAGIAGPAVLARHAPDRVASLGIRYRAAVGRLRHEGIGGDASAVPLAVTAADAVSGCAMLLSREALERAGTFDEEFFFGFEDIDLCLRARAAGVGVIVAGDARVFHEGGRAIGARSAARLYYAARNHLKVAFRPDAPGGRFAVPARAGIVVALNVAHAVTAPGATLPARLAAVSRGTVDALRGRWGRMADVSASSATPALPRRGSPPHRSGDRSDDAGARARSRS